MGEFMTSKRIVAVALTLGLGIAGCSGSTEKDNRTTTSSSTSPQPKKVTCKAERPDLWIPPTEIEPALNMKAVAKPLGVSQSAVEAGKYGGAICDEAITPESVAGQTALVTVQGIGNTCVAIGLQDLDSPDTHILAICAKE